MSIDLIEYGWILRPSGRYVHPQFRAEGADRLRVFTEAEALTFTALQLDGVCADCGTVHDTASTEATA